MQFVSRHASLWIIGFAFCFVFAGCNEPVRTLPTLKPRKQPPPNPVNAPPGFMVPYGAGMTSGGMTYSGMTYSGMTYSGLRTYSGMTYSGMTYSGLTYSGMTGSGLTTRGGIYMPSQGIRLPTGITNSTAEITMAEETGILLPSSEEAEQNDTTESIEVTVDMTDFDGLMEAIQSSKKVTVVDIWSTSCLPCMKEFPGLVKLSNKYADEVACISLNVDYIGLKKKIPASYVPRVLKFLSKQEATFANFVSTEADEDIRGKLGIDSIPAILIYDETGKLAHKVTVDNSGDELTYLGDVVPKVQKMLGN